MDFWGQGRGTLIGSMPFEEAEEAVELIISRLPELPCWPQLPRRPQEGMLVQFCEGLPGFRLKEGIPYLFTGEDFEREMLSFYEAYLAWEAGGNLPETAALSPTNAPGFYLLEEKLRSQKAHPYGLKGQVTGPFTLATGLKKEDGEAVFYDLQLRDLITKHLCLKAAWQTERLKALSPRVVIFMDEPALAGFGSSSYVGVSKEEVLSVLGEVAQTIASKQGVPGIHVCANTDWALVFEAGVKVVNFDAYGYLDRFLLFGRDIRKFLEEGGNLALGIVPTLDPEALARETEDGLFARLEEALSLISKASDLSIKDIINQSLITPSCGMGTLEPELADKAVRLTAGLSRRVAKMK
ncbi:hypothetical protein [Thermosulfuriphilus sp.]